MAWTIEYLPKAEKDLRKLDKSIQREIVDYMEKRIAASDQPEQFGKPHAVIAPGCGATASAMTASSARFRNTDSLCWSSPSAIEVRFMIEIHLCALQFQAATQSD